MCYFVSYRKYLGFFCLVLNLRLICQLEFSERCGIVIFYSIYSDWDVERTRKSEVGSRKSKVVWTVLFFVALPTSPNFSRQYFITQNIIFQGHQKWLITQMEKSTIESQNWAFLLSSSEFLFFYFRVPGARFSKVPLIVPSPECFTCAVFNI